MAYIKSYCRITNNEVFLDGQKIDINCTEDNTWLVDIYRSIGMHYPKFFKMDNLCKSGILAVELLMRNLLQDTETPKKNWSVICVNSCSSLDTDISYQKTIREKNNYYPSPSVFVYTLANIVTGEIAIRHKIMGSSSAYICETMNPKFMVDIVENGFNFDKNIDFILCGWVDYLDDKCDVLMFILSRNDDNGLKSFSENSFLDL